ncbi:MAG: peptidylprolyl isomerase, partial [Actinomycetes bacterium]
MTTTATLHTSMGDINVNLFPDQAPKTVRNFTGLADGTGEWTDPKTR